MNGKKKVPRVKRVWSSSSTSVNKKRELLDMEVSVRSPPKFLKYYDYEWMKDGKRVFVESDSEYPYSRVSFLAEAGTYHCNVVGKTEAGIALYRGTSSRQVVIQMARCARCTKDFDVSDLSNESCEWFVVPRLYKLDEPRFNVDSTFFTMNGLLEKVLHVMLDSRAPSVESKDFKPYRNYSITQVWMTSSERIQNGNRLVAKLPKDVTLLLSMTARSTKITEVFRQGMDPVKAKTILLEQISYLMILNAIYNFFEHTKSRIDPEFSDVQIELAKTSMNELFDKYFDAIIPLIDLNSTKREDVDLCFELFVSPLPALKKTLQILTNKHSQQDRFDRRRTEGIKSIKDLTEATKSFECYSNGNDNCPEPTKSKRATFKNESSQDPSVVFGYFDEAKDPHSKGNEYTFNGKPKFTGRHHETSVLPDECKLIRKSTGGQIKRLLADLDAIKDDVQVIHGSTREGNGTVELQSEIDSVLDRFQKNPTVSNMERLLELVKYFNELLQ